ncbi:MAG: repair protein recN (Recombination protein N) protein [candidate division NC10 bacterium CSP1-5]|nr:MAG: repair protein recN (Recombination protein N) protein [candidate division NC10 bacterium CSP1-5]
MLREIAIRHFTVVDQVRANFGFGLNVLTGETGAGKSIVISALSLALGARGDTELIRSGEGEAVVEAAFAIPDAGPVQDLLAAQGIPMPEEDDLVVRRHLAREGRSRAYVNGTMTGVAMVKALGEHLVDILGQHESVLLQNPRRHLELLDAFGVLTEEVQDYQALYRRWQALNAERDALQQGEREKAQRKDLLEHQIREIDAAHLTEGEEEAVQAERAILTHHEKLLLAVEEAYGRLEGDERGMLSTLFAVEARLREAGRIDARLSPVGAMADEAKTLLKEVVLALRDYRDRLDFDPRRLEAIEERLHILSRLKKKYGVTAGEILAYGERAALELKRLEGAEERLVSLDGEIRGAEEALWERGERLSSGRAEAAKRLAQAVVGELKQLGMARADFRVELKRVAGEDRRGSLRPTGLEEAEFLFAPNPGEGFRPLGKIASGGELSRTMLALKNILASVDQTPTLLFDEVDAGIGGSMAEVVGKKLWRVSRERQVICITHLPQIAAFADVHLRVEKKVERGRTEARVLPLAEEERVEELGRMLGGSEKSTTPFKHARELLRAAASWKQQQRKGAG